MGDPAFDLANLAVNNGLDDAEVLEAYGGADPDVHALMRFMSDFREAMWGAVQSTISELDFDFHAYCAEHFDRMREAGGEGRLEQLLEEAGGAPS